MQLIQTFAGLPWDLEAKQGRGDPAGVHPWDEPKLTMVIIMLGLAKRRQNGVRQREPLQPTRALDPRRRWGVQVLTVKMKHEDV